MKLSYILSSLYLVITIFFIKIQKIITQKSFNSIFDIDFNDISNDTLKKYKDFDFYNDKKSIISIQDKLKKISCMNLINKFIKENTEIKKKLKEAKTENKQKYKIFIKNMTDNCINKINNDEINDILNYQNIISNKINYNEELLKFNEYFDKLYNENEYDKKIKQIEIEKNERYYKIKIFIYFIGIVIFFIIIFLIRKPKKKIIEDKNNNIKSKKKLKKN